MRPTQVTSLSRVSRAYARWLDARDPAFRAQGLSDAVQVLDAFHVVKLGTQVVDEVRRRVQLEQLGHRGHKHDPLYKIRGLLRHGVEHLTERQHRRLQAGLAVGDPDGQVELAWACYQQLRSVYSGTASAGEGRQLADKLIASFPTCPVPEVARLGRTLQAWRAQVLAYFDTDGLSNGGTEASTCSSRRPGGWLTATATSPTTDSGCSWPQAAPAPDESRSAAPNHAQVRRAG